MSDNKTKRPLSAREMEEEFSDEEFEDEFSNDYEDDEDDDDLLQNDFGHEMRKVIGEMPDHPKWVDGNLVVPPSWNGLLSETKFSVKHTQNGTVLSAELPGEFQPTLSAVCTDGNGLLDASYCIDAGISVASEPEAVPISFLVENSLSLHMAVTMFNHAANALDQSMLSVFRPPERAELYDEQIKINGKTSAYLRAAARRITTLLEVSIDPSINHASRVSVESQTFH